MKKGRYWPTVLGSDHDFRATLSERQQGWVQKLWLSPTIDSAGMAPLELDWWSRGCTPQIPVGEICSVLDSLAPRWVVTDYDAQMLLLVPIIRMDSITQPYVYISACNSIEAARSDLLAEHAYSELVKLPIPISDDFKTQQRIDKAHDAVLVAMEKRREQRIDRDLADTLSTPSRHAPKTLSAAEVESAVGVEPLDTLSRPSVEGKGREGKGAKPRRPPTPRTVRGAADPSRCSVCRKRPPGGGPHYADLCDECMRARHSAVS
jgi:hypothetical protein